MFHACVQRFDVTGNLEKFCKILGTKLALDCLTPRNWAAYANVSSSLKCACFCLLHLSLQDELLRFYLWLSDCLARHVGTCDKTCRCTKQGPDAKVTKFSTIIIGSL